MPFHLFAIGDTKGVLGASLKIWTHFKDQVFNLVTCYFNFC